MKTFLVCLLLLIAGAGLTIINFSCKMANNGLTVIYNEFSPSALLAKYSHLKDLHAALSSLKSTITVLQSNLDTAKSTYGEDPLKWPRDVRQDIASARQELVGTRARFNQLAAEYNADMVKFNYRFCNVGDLPHGATEPLPREYVIYQER